MLYVLVALALPHGYGHRRHRELFRHNEEGVAEQQIDALTLKLEKLEDKVDELMISNAERRMSWEEWARRCGGKSMVEATGLMLLYMRNHKSEIPEYEVNAVTEVCHLGGTSPDFKLDCSNFAKLMSHRAGPTPSDLEP